MASSENQVSSMKGRVNVPKSNTPVFSPNTWNQLANPIAGVVEQLTSSTGRSTEGGKLPIVEPIPVKDPYGNYNPLTPQKSLTPTLTGAGVTSSGSGIDAVKKDSISIPQVKITKEIVASANAKRSQIGVAPVKAKDLPIPQDGSITDKINRSIARGDYNNAFALSVNDAVDNVVVGGAKNIPKLVGDGLKVVGVGLGFLGRTYSEYAVANPALAIQGTYLVAKNNLEKFIDDTEDAPFKILDNLKKQSISEVLGSEGKSLLKGTYESSYGIGNNLDGFEDAKNRLDYLFGTKSGSQEDLWQTRSETRDELRNANPMDTSNKATYDALEPYTIVADIAMDLIATAGVSAGASALTRLSSVAAEGSMVGPLFAPIARTLESLVNPSLSGMMKVGGSVAIGDTLSYSLTGKRLGAGNKASEEAVNALEAGGALGGAFKGVGYVAPKVAKLVTDNMPSFDSMVKSDAIKSLINSSESAKKEFLKGYQFAQTKIMNSVEDARGTRGSIKIGEDKLTYKDIGSYSEMGGTPLEGKTNAWNQDRYDKLKMQLSTEPQKEPIRISKNNQGNYVIDGGNHRFEVLKEMGKPVNAIDGVTGKEITIYPDSKEIPNIELPSITELNPKNIKDATDVEKLKRSIKLDNSNISDEEATLSAKFQANTNKGVIATINNSQNSKFIDSLAGFLPEGKSGIGDVFKASIKKAGLFIKSGFDKGSYTRYLEKANGSKVSVTPDVGVRSISGKVDYIYNQFKGIQESLGDGVEDFQVYITNKRQYNLVVERENARKALSDELVTLGKSKKDIARASEIKTQLSHPDFQSRSVGSLTGHEYARGFELTSAHLDTTYAPQIKKMEEANDTFLSVLRDSGYISQETLDNLSNSDLYVKTKFIFDNSDKLEKDFGRAPSVLKKIASGTEEGVLDYNLFKNMVTHYTNGISSAMKNDSIRHIANVVQNNPAFKILDESLGNNSIQFFVDGEKKFLTGPKFFLDDIAKSAGVKQSALGQIRQSTMARAFALPTSIVKEFITGRLNPIFQPSQVLMEISNAALNSAANNKGGIRVSTIIPSLLNASGVKDDVESEALQSLFKWMGGDSVNNFRTDMKGLFDVDGLDKMMDDSFGIDKLKTPVEIVKEIATYPIKKISALWHGYGNVLSEIETTTSRIPSFAGYIYKSMEGKISQKEFVDFYKNNGQNPYKLQKFLEGKGVDVNEATQLTVDQFNYDRSGDLIAFLNMYIPYTRTGVESTIQLGRISGKLGSGVSKGNLNAIGVSSTITTIGSGIGYYLYKFNDTPERRRMAEFDPTPEKPGFYIGWAKDKNGRFMVDEKINKVEINALPVGISDMVTGFQSIFHKISNGSVPGGDRIIDKYISSKIGLFNFESDTGLSISQLGTIASIIKDIKSPATNITDRTSAASVAISHYFPSYTPPQIDRLFRDVLGSTAAPVVKNLLVDAMESAGVDIEKLTKGGVDKYEDSKLHKYFGQDDLGKGMIDLLGDMVRVNRKEVGTMTMEEIKLMRESGKLGTEKLTESQLIEQSIDKKVKNWSNMSKEERKSAVESISIEGMSKEETYKKIIERIKASGESSMDKRVGGLSADEYNTLVLGKLKTTREKAIKIRDDLKSGIITESKAKSLIKLISE